VTKSISSLSVCLEETRQVEVRDGQFPVEPKRRLVRFDGSGPETLVFERDPEVVACPRAFRVCVGGLAIVRLGFVDPSVLVKEPS
jgi:hypothetical protein